MRNINIVDINLERDIQEISSFIQGYVDSTYLSQIRNQIHTYKRKSEETPFKEAQLLQAIVPFINKEAQSKFSSLIQMITYSQMIQNMLPDYGVEDLFTRDNNKENTVYDYIHQAIVTLFLYKAIVWSEEHGNN